MWLVKNLQNFCNFQFLVAVASNWYPVTKTSLIDTIHGPNLETITLPDAETSTKDSFKSKLYLSEVFAFYV